MKTKMLFMLGLLSLMNHAVYAETEILKEGSWFITKDIDPLTEKESAVIVTPSTKNAKHALFIMCLPMEDKEFLTYSYAGEEFEGGIKVPVMTKVDGTAAKKHNLLALNGVITSNLKEKESDISFIHSLKGKSNLSVSIRYQGKETDDNYSLIGFDKALSHVLATCNAGS